MRPWIVAKGSNGARLQKVGRARLADRRGSMDASH